MPARQPKRGRLWLNDGSCIRLRPEHRNHVWAYDFVFDRTHEGRPLKLLNVVDEFTRECLTIDVARKQSSRDRHPLLGPGARASDPSGSSNSSNQAVRPGARGVWRPTGLPQADRRVEGPPPILERRNDDRRPQRHGARDGSLEADLERGSASAHQAQYR